jgi:hypothetical protein
MIVIYRLGSYLAVNDFDPSVRSRAPRSRQLILLSLDVIARRNRRFGGPEIENGKPVWNFRAKCDKWALSLS